MLDPSVLTKQLLEPIAGDKKDAIPALRMLWWEAWGVSSADMKRQTEDDDKPRRLTPAELNTRRKEVLEKLPGLTISQELDVSDAILTDCVRLWDQNRITYMGKVHGPVHGNSWRGSSCGKRTPQGSYASAVRPAAMSTRHWLTICRWIKRCAAETSRSPWLTWWIGRFTKSCAKI